MEAKVIKQKISQIKAAGTKLDRGVQEVGLAILEHVEAHGDVTLADALVNAMPRGGRKLALVEWLIAFGKLNVIPASGKENKQAIEAGRVFSYAKDKATDIEAAKAMLWHEFRKEKAPAEAFDVQAQVKALITRLQKAREKGLTIEHADEALAEAKALVTALEQGRAG